MNHRYIPLCTHSNPQIVVFTKIIRPYIIYIYIVIS